MKILYHDAMNNMLAAPDENKHNIKIDDGSNTHFIKDKKTKIHCNNYEYEIEDWVETHLCKLCDTPIARITGCVSSLRIKVGDSLPLVLAVSGSTNRVTPRHSIFNPYAHENYITHLEGDELRQVRSS